MATFELSRKDVIYALRLCAAKDTCTNCPALLLEKKQRKQCFSTLMVRAAELLAEDGRKREDGHD